MALPDKFKVDRNAIKTVKLTLTTTDGETVSHDFFLRPLSISELSIVGLIEQLDDVDEACKAKARLIATALVEADGKTPLCTPEEACELDPQVATKLIEVIKQHNARGKVKAA